MGRENGNSAVRVNNGGREQADAPGNTLTQEIRYGSSHGARPAAKLQRPATCQKERSKRQKGQYTHGKRMPSNATVNVRMAAPAATTKPNRTKNLSTETNRQTATSRKQRYTPYHRTCTFTNRQENRRPVIQQQWHHGRKVVTIATRPGREEYSG